MARLHGELTVRKRRSTCPAGCHSESAMENLFRKNEVQTMSSPLGLTDGRIHSHTTPPRRPTRMNSMMPLKKIRPAYD